MITYITLRHAYACSCAVVANNHERLTSYQAFVHYSSLLGNAAAVPCYDLLTLN